MASQCANVLMLLMDEAAPGSRERSRAALGLAYDDAGQLRPRRLLLLPGERALCSTYLDGVVDRAL